MPKDALADLFQELETLVSGMDDWLADVPHMRPLRDEFAAMLQGTKALAAEQNSLRARRQSVTQQLRILKGQGRDLVIKARAAIRSHYGHRNEGLVRFHIRPVRRRSRAIPEQAGIAESVPAEPSATTPAVPEKIETSPDAASVSPVPAGDSHSEP
ncbi:MAG TPA: hypothetical protein VIA62_15445 [Thermoanaerobaculia bacterium]|jgi:hypothetical protein|nr:hypothetical protein [Thermoanaerobaculia bacterium]